MFDGFRFATPTTDEQAQQPALPELESHVDRAAAEAEKRRLQHDVDRLTRKAEWLNDQIGEAQSVLENAQAAYALGELSLPDLQAAQDRLEEFERDLRACETGLAKLAERRAEAHRQLLLARRDETLAELEAESAFRADAWAHVLDAKVGLRSAFADFHRSDGRVANLGGTLNQLNRELGLPASHVVTGVGLPPYALNGVREKDLIAAGKRDNWDPRAFEVSPVLKPPT